VYNLRKRLMIGDLSRSIIYYMIARFVPSYARKRIQNVDDQAYRALFGTRVSSVKNHISLNNHDKKSSVMGCSAPTWWDKPQPIHAFRLSVVSVIMTLIAAAAGLMAYGPTSSTLVLSWGLENVVDLLSSLVVLWRFYNPGVTEARLLLLKKREKRAR